MTPPTPLRQKVPSLSPAVEEVILIALNKNPQQRFPSVQAFANALANDPVHVTINTIQIDNTNGRMIWDTTLKDITGSNRGFSINQYNLQANASQTTVAAVLAQTQFGNTNQADVQAIFAFVPSHNVTYTLTVIVNWSFNTSDNITFDPVKITF